MAKNRPLAYDIDPQRKLAGYLLTGLFVAWVITMMTIHYSLAFHHGHGTGFGDGHLQPSELTPGGPYYPADWRGPR